MKHSITLVPGDGIGPEVTAAVVTVLEHAGLDVEWDSHLAGAAALERHGETLPAPLLDSIRKNKVACALGHVLSEGRVRTLDLGGSATTTAFADAIVEQVTAA